MTHVLQLDDVHKSYPGRQGRVAVLSGINLTVGQGELVWLRGASGSGKTTLLSIAGLLAPPDGGNVVIGGESATGLSSGRAAALRARRVGFVFQQHHLIGHLTAVENIVLPALDLRRAAEPRARTMLADLGLAHRVDFTANQLSGGERQRIAIARALVNSPNLVLADEPVSGLDHDSADEVLRQLKKATGEGCAVVVASHDDTVAGVADRTVTMTAGRLDEATHDPRSAQEAP